MTQDIYDAAIVAEARAAIGKGRLAEPTVSLRCDNPLCGDRITLDLAVSDGRVAAVAHETRGCLLTRAAASVLARHLAERPVVDLGSMASAAEQMLATGEAPPGWEDLGMFAPVRAVKSRHECVLLPFKALAEAAGQLPQG
jgi:nitrogen fixation protein NifU and related proteins